MRHGTHKFSLIMKFSIAIVQCVKCWDWVWLNFWNVEEKCCDNTDVGNWIIIRFADYMFDWFVDYVSLENIKPGSDLSLVKSQNCRSFGEHS